MVSGGGSREKITGQACTRSTNMQPLAHFFHCAVTVSHLGRNTVNLSRLPPTERKRIRMETEILAELNHDHIINFYHVWENKEKG